MNWCKIKSGVRFQWDKIWSSIKFEARQVLKWCKSCSGGWCGGWSDNNHHHPTFTERKLAICRNQTFPFGVVAIVREISSILFKVVLLAPNWSLCNAPEKCTTRPVLCSRFLDTFVVVKVKVISSYSIHVRLYYYFSPVMKVPVGLFGALLTWICCF